MSLTIVTYHYVRDLPQTRFPAIKGLLTDDFRSQVRHIKENYQPIRGEDLIAAAVAGSIAELPENAALLTFDDGYRDHVDTVLPILEREHLTACFFPSVQPALEGRVLDVNKIHFLLASVADARDLVDRIIAAIDEHAGQYGMDAGAAYWNAAGPSYFDTREVAFVKHMLQKGLPAPFRQSLLASLFSEFVTTDEASFAAELYMSDADLRALVAAGMLIGGHGYSHRHLDTLGTDEQRSEIQQALVFLRRLGCSTRHWMMCYPYGAHDQSVRELLRSTDCAVGFTTRSGVVDRTVTDFLALPRVDTRDLARMRRPESSASPSERLGDPIVANDRRE